MADFTILWRKKRIQLSYQEHYNFIKIYIKFEVLFEWIAVIEEISLLWVGLWEQ